VVLGKGDCIVSDLSNKDSDLAAQIAALEKAQDLLPHSQEIAEGLRNLRIALAAMEAEPDYEAWRPALNAYYAGYGLRATAEIPFDEADKSAIRGLQAALDEADESAIRGLQAALPLAPADPVDEAWIERTAREAVREGEDNCDASPTFSKAAAYDYAKASARAAIRATLNRGARWPSEAELRRMENQCASDTRRSLGHANAAAREMARRLRAYQTGDHAKPEPEWIDWHGGECPVPAGKCVTIETHSGARADGIASGFDWHAFNHIRRYRILGDAA
jgi:hypothetical protein